MRGKSELSASQRELAKYAEKDEEDYDDMFDENPSLGERESPRGKARLMNRIYKATVPAAYQALEFVLEV
jgi:hypothetical protein